MKYIKGNLVKMFTAGEVDVMVHGCNCFNTMGSGIAKQIRAEYPIVYTADCKTIKGDRNKLGTFSLATISYNKFIVNAYIQYRYGKDKRHANYDAIKNVMHNIKKYFGMLTIGIPLIGAGLAGGDWKTIEGIIDSINFENLVCIKL